MPLNSRTKRNKSVTAAIFTHGGSDGVEALKTAIKALYFEADVCEHTFVTLSETESKRFSIKLFFDGINEGKSCKVPIRFAFFCIDVSGYPENVRDLTAGLPLFWLTAESDDALQAIIDALAKNQQQKIKTLQFYGVKLGDFCRRIIWDRDVLHQAETDLFHPRIAELEASIHNDSSNTDRVVFSSESADGLLEKGIIKLVKDKFYLAVSGMLLMLDRNLTSGTPKGMQVLLDEKGLFRIAKYKSARRLEPLARFLHLVISQGLLLKHSHWKIQVPKLIIRAPEE